jgi:hypothetical protein
MTALLSMRTRSLILTLWAVPFAGAVGQVAWTVDRTAILDVPGVGADGKVTFGYAAGATRLANGGLLIADRSESSIRVVDASGKLLRTVGRAGDGPGEFQTMIWAGRCGTDSLLVWDLRRRQASVVGASGSVARQFGVPAGDTAQTPYQFSCSSGGGRAMAYLSTPRPVRDTAPPRDPNIRAAAAAVYRIAPDGAVLQRLGEIPAGELVALMGPTGGAEFEAAVQATVSMMPAQNRQAMTAPLMATPMPDRIPPVSALFGDPDGLLWVQTSPPGARAIDFVVMRVDGRVVARTQIPLPLTVFEIGRDYILGSYTDSSDEMHVALYRLRRQ